MQWLTTKYFIIGDVVYATPLQGIQVLVTAAWCLIMWRFVKRRLESLPRLGDKTDRT